MGGLPQRVWGLPSGSAKITFMDSPLSPDFSPDEALAHLSWQVELGADEAILDAPINRYELAARPARANPAKGSAPPVPQAIDPVVLAEAQAAGADSLEALQAAMAGYEGCALRETASQLVFADGNPLARVMVIGEAPGRDEDREGRPFVGRAGRLLDLMLAEIGLSRAAPSAEAAVYITNVVPWRPPQNRTPEPAEIAMMLPFLRRHIALVQPDVLVLMGNTPCQALLGRSGITRLRGQWQQAEALPVMPMVHPAYLLRNPAAKREAWADLLDLRARLSG